MAGLKVCKIMTSIKKEDQELFLSLFCSTRAFLKWLGGGILTKKRLLFFSCTDHKHVEHSGTGHN